MKRSPNCIIESGEVVAVQCGFCPDEAVYVCDDVFRCPTCGFEYNGRGYQLTDGRTVSAAGY